MEHQPIKRRNEWVGTLLKAACPTTMIQAISWSSRGMDTPLNGIAFFARSENRVRVLRAISEETQTRQQLRENLSMSRSTFGRVLNEFEERDLIRRSGHGYTTTPAAEAILEKFLPLLETMEGIQNLGGAIEWLPPPVRSLDFRHLRSADVITPTEANPSRPFDFVAERFRRADEIRTLARTVPGRFRTIGHELSVEGTVNVELVIQASWFDNLPPEPDRLKPWRDRAARNEVWTIDEVVPLTFHVCDESAIIWLSEDYEDKRVIQGVVASENPVVLSWAESLYQEYRAEAKPLDPTILPET